MIGMSCQRKVRHAELVSASISPHRASACAAGWTLKQVQGDEAGEADMLRLLRHNVPPVEG